MAGAPPSPRGPGRSGLLHGAPGRGQQLSCRPAGLWRGMRPKWTFPASAFRRSHPALIRSVSQLQVILDPWRLPEHPLRSPALASPPPACYFPPGPAAALVSDTGPALAASGAAPAWSSACKPSCRPVVMTGRRPHPHGRQHPWGWGLQLPVAEWLSDSPKIKGCVRLEERWGPGRWAGGWRVGDCRLLQG